MYNCRGGCTKTARGICLMIVERTHADHLHAIFFRHVISWLMSLCMSGIITLCKHADASRKRPNSFNKQDELRFWKVSFDTDTVIESIKVLSRL